LFGETFACSGKGNRIEIEARAGVSEIYSVVSIASVIMWINIIQDVTLKKG